MRHTRLTRRGFFSAVSASSASSIAVQRTREGASAASALDGSEGQRLLAGTAQVELGRNSVESGRPAHARALVVSDGDTSIGLVSVDVIRMDRTTAESVRASVAEAGVSLDEIAVSATHTHFVAGSANPSTAMRQAMADALVAAHQALAPATLRSGAASRYQLTTNRNSRGGVFGHVDIAGRDLDPDRDVDPELSILLVEPDDGPPSIFYNYAIHVIADFVPFAVDRVQATIPGALVSFHQGAAGDINPWRATEWQDTFNVRDGGKVAYDKYIGAHMGDLVLQAVADARSRPAAEQSVSARSQEVQLELKPVDANALQTEIAELTDMIECAGIPIAPPNHHPLTRERQYDVHDLALAEMGGSQPATIQFIRIADLGIITAPGEAFVQHGLDFKAAMPTRTKMVAGYTNEHFHYIPTADQLKYGGYGTRNRWLSPNGINTMRSTAFSLMES